MAVGLSAAEANSIVAGLDGSYLQVHVGDPGAAGTANVAAGISTRQQVILTTPAGGSASNISGLSWVTTAGEDPTHFSLWTMAVGGTFKFSGTITSDPYASGDTFDLDPGDIVIDVTTVAA